VLIAIVLAATLFTSDSIAVADVRAAYPEVFKVTFTPWDGQWFVSATADTLPTDHRLAPFVSERRQYLTYIASSALNSVDRRELSTAAEQQDVRDAFYRRLTTDTLYDRAILAPLAAYLRLRRGVLTGYTAPRKVHIPMRRAVAVAARFYNPDVLLPDGGIGVHVCVVKNGLFADLGERDLAVEALAFAAVWADTNLPDSLALADDDFDRAWLQIKSVPVTLPPAERIARSQTLMWSTFEAGPGLPALLNDYATKWPDLPFVLDP
jgi:hypothetical protein